MFFVILFGIIVFSILFIVYLDNKAQQEYTPPKKESKFFTQDNTIKLKEINKDKYATIFYHSITKIPNKHIVLYSIINPFNGNMQLSNTKPKKYNSKMFSLILTHHIKKHNLKTKTIAKKINTSQRSVQRWVKGDSSPSKKTQDILINWFLKFKDK